MKERAILITDHSLFAASVDLELLCGVDNEEREREREIVLL